MTSSDARRSTEGMEEGMRSAALRGSLTLASALFTRVRRAIFGHQPTRRERDQRAKESEANYQRSLAYLRGLEAKLTPDQWTRVFAKMRANGWQYGDTPPMFVWAEVYRQVLAEGTVASEASAPAGRNTPEVPHD